MAKKDVAQIPDISMLEGYETLFPERIAIDLLLNERIVVHHAELTTVLDSRGKENKVVILKITAGEDSKFFEVMTSAWQILRFCNAAIEQNFFPFQAYIVKEDRAIRFSVSSNTPF